MYPNQELSEETVKNYSLEWLQVAREIGTDEFSRALVEAVRASKFFPSIADIRQYAGVTEKQQTLAGGDAAWLLVQDHIRKWGSQGMPHFSGGKEYRPPRLPERIAYAVRIVGGLAAIEFVSDDSLPFMRRDFVAAWERYPQSSAAYTALQLECPQPRLLSTGETQREPEPTSPLESVGKLMQMPSKQTYRELTDAEIEDRREMLRQQAEKLLKGSSADTERTTKGDATAKHTG